jgi:hypothetical protein
VPLPEAVTAVVSPETAVVGVERVDGVVERWEVVVVDVEEEELHPASTAGQTTATRTSGPDHQRRPAIQTGEWVLGSVFDVSVRPRHISSEDPSPQVMKWGATLRRAGSS